MKKFMLGLIIGMILTASVTTFASVDLNIVPNPFPVFINGVKTDVEGYLIDGRLFMRLIDFKKAGLDVRFNQDKKQIEITKEVTPMANIENPTATTSVAKENEFLKSVGLEGFNLNGVEYVKITSIGIKYDKFRNIKRNTSNGQLSLTLYSDGNCENVLLENIPIVLIDNNYPTIEYNYYLNTLLPLIK